MTLFYSHKACLEHSAGAQHPERPERLTAILERLSADDFADLDRCEAPLAEVAQIARAHPLEYVEEILNAVPTEGRVFLDGDTSMSPGSGEAALRAAGAVCAAVDAVADGVAKTAFCAARPPGHHAEPAQAMGFCLFNNIVVGAHQARSVHGLQRIAVIDFDVHHGNGTQAMFERDKNLFYGSTHQSPFYPGTGHPSETGIARNIVNAPLAAHAGSAEFRTAMEDNILPALDAFAPSLLMISAGFDAHMRDPLAQIQLTDDDFAWVTGRLCEVAEEHGEGRVVSVLEGGYDLEALASGVAAHLKVLMASEG